MFMMRRVLTYGVRLAVLGWRYIPTMPRSLLPCHGLASSAPPIPPPILPPLPPPRAVKLGLPQLAIHIVMRAAHPAAQPLLPRRVDGLAPHPGPEVVGAHPARVQPAEEREEAGHVGALRGRGLLGVGRGDGVQERPGLPAEGVDVGRAVRG